MHLLCSHKYSMSMSLFSSPSTLLSYKPSALLPSLGFTFLSCGGLNYFSVWALYLPSCSAKTAYAPISWATVLMYFPTTRKSTPPTDTTTNELSLHKLQGSNSGPLLPHRPKHCDGGVSKRRKALTHAYDLRTRTKAALLDGETQQDKSLDTVHQRETGYGKDGHCPSVNNSAEADLIPESYVHDSVLPLPECSGRAALPEEASQHDRELHADLWDVDISTDVEDQRGLYKFLNPGSEYQANLDAVSPQCKDLFVRCCPVPSDNLDAELEDDSVDPYWTWSQEKEQWSHKDKERGTTVWFPEDFD
ncbi:hypothetical protein GGR54DRAFT_195140 [Hypoxylon sp. NC1633]|nr:hypothetical protein GGR54DRAFT_195140 [Hypoxylon sp. NC1633]